MVKTIGVTAKERVEQEQAELLEKLHKLTTFFYSDKGRSLDERSYSLLGSQMDAMLDYLNILNERLIAWKE